MRSCFTIACFLIISLIAQAQEATCACCTDTYGEFDFWLGSWNVTNPKDVFVGTNYIEKIQGNCVLRENWTSAKKGYTGTSVNFYNKNTGQWEQVWVDNQGGNLHLKGNRKGNQMILQSEELTNKEGQPFFHRITWTLNDDGSVRQLWETITNETEISVLFDGLYRKAE